MSSDIRPLDHCRSVCRGDWATSRNWRTYLITTIDRATFGLVCHEAATTIKTDSLRKYLTQDFVSPTKTAAACHAYRELCAPNATNLVPFFADGEVLDSYWAADSPSSTDLPDDRGIIRRAFGRSLRNEFNTDQLQFSEKSGVIASNTEGKKKSHAREAALAAKIIATALEAGEDPEEALLFTFSGRIHNPSYEGIDRVFGKFEGDKFIGKVIGKSAIYAYNKKCVAVHTENDANIDVGPDASIIILVSEGVRKTLAENGEGNSVLSIIANPHFDQTQSPKRTSLDPISSDELADLVEEWDLSLDKETITRRLKNYLLWVTPKDNLDCQTALVLKRSAHLTPAEREMLSMGQ